MAGERETDVVIVGAALAGLVAGAILTRRGQRVVLLDQTDVVGGHRIRTPSAGRERKRHQHAHGARRLEPRDDLAADAKGRDHPRARRGRQRRGGGTAEGHDEGEREEGGDARRGRHRASHPYRPASSSSARASARLSSPVLAGPSVATKCVSFVLNINARKSRRTADVRGRPSSGPRITSVCRPSTLAVERGPDDRRYK